MGVASSSIAMLCWANALFLPPFFNQVERRKRELQTREAWQQSLRYPQSLILTKLWQYPACCLVAQLPHVTSRTIIITLFINEYHGVEWILEFRGNGEETHDPIFSRVLASCPGTFGVRDNLKFRDHNCTITNIVLPRKTRMMNADAVGTFCGVVVTQKNKTRREILRSSARHTRTHTHKHPHAGSTVFFFSAIIFASFQNRGIIANSHFDRGASCFDNKTETETLSTRRRKHRKRPTTKTKLCSFPPRTTCQANKEAATSQNEPSYYTEQCCEIFKTNNNSERPSLLQQRRRVTKAHKTKSFIVYKPNQGN